MRSIQLHVPSLALSLVACCVVFICMSQGAPQISPPRVSYGPHPRDMIQIKEGTPYVVPTGTVFVLTGLGSAGSTGTIVTTQFKVNGQLEASCTSGTGFGVPSVLATADGFTAVAGAQIEVDDQLTGTAYQSGRAWGYLSR